MTSISSVGSTAATAYGSVKRHDPMQAVTDLLGGDRKAIFDELRKGKSLDDIAKEKGVSHDDLTGAIAAGLPSDDTAKAEEIATTQGLPQGPPPGGHHHGLPPAAPSDATGALGSSTSSATRDRLDSLSTLLGTDSSTLVKELMSGTSLASLASVKGVTSNQIASALQRGDLFDAYA